MFSSNPNKFIGKRIQATLIDYTIVFGVTMLYVVVVGHLENGVYTVEGWAAFIPLLFWFCYFVICENMLGGTIGHQLLKIKVVTETGGNPTFSQTLIRRLCDAIEIVWCFGLIAFLIVSKNDSTQRLGDILAKTIVVGFDTVFIKN